MKLNKKMIKVILKACSHVEFKSQLDVYGNGSILEVNSKNKLYLLKSNYAGSDCEDVFYCDNVKKDINKIIGYLNYFGFEEV